MKLAENLKRLRMQKQLSQPELADKAEVSKGYIYMLESGEMANPSLEKLLQISKALDCTIADLVGHPKAAVKADAAVEIPEALQEFAKRMKREGNPLDETELKSLAHTQYRGRRPRTADDWAYVYRFLKQTLEDRK
jgi:transcriptional regulator with XRE-family HTH domain